MRNWNPPKHRLTPVRPPPPGSSTGAQPSLTNPWGAKLTSGPGAAPNAKPQPPPTIVQMQGQPAAPGGKPSMKPRGGDETRAPKPAVEDLPPKVHAATAAHLAATVSGNLGHGAVHLKPARKVAKRLPKSPEKAELEHHLAHASKHVDEAAEHAAKGNQHLNKLARVKGAVDALASATPGDKPRKKAAKES